MSITDNINSVFDTVKKNWQKLDLKKWSHDIGGSSAEAVHAALYFVLAFGAGFLLKKYFKYLISGFFLAVIMIKLLEYNSLLTINWSSVKAFSGINSTADINTSANLFIAWIKSNIFLFAASVIGLLLGYRLG
jgi:uncharacterized membrane protein (Fun14 family)